MRYTSLRDWLRRHEEIEGRWEELWIAAPEVDADGFLAGLASLGSALRLHIDQEESTLLQAWDTWPDPPPNATATVLRRDHDLLLALLDDLEVRAADRRARLGHLHRLREVVRHHDAREASSIKPALDDRLDGSVVASWLRRFEEEEDALPPPFRFEPRERGVPAGPDPEDAVVADAPVGQCVAAMEVPDHPKGVILHARAVAKADEVDRCDDPRARRKLSAELWGALQLVRIASGQR